MSKNFFFMTFNILILKLADLKSLNALFTKFDEESGAILVSIA